MEEQETPPRIPPVLQAAPRIRQILWCNFPQDAQLPEFWKMRPVLVISKTSKLSGSITILPFSTKSQPDNPAAYSLVSLLDGKRTWVICNHISTFAVSRMTQPHGKFIRLPNEDFQNIIAIMLQYLPRLNP